VETAPPKSTPKVETAPPKSTPKVEPVIKAPASKAEPITKVPSKIPSASRIATVAGALSPAAALSIERETGKPAKDAIKNVGQIVKNDPKPGVSSYGVFGINSGGSVQTFVKDNPQFELNAKPTSKEFDEQWTKISNEQPQKMLEAQLKWYDKNITVPLNNDLNKLVPLEFANDPRVLTYISDRRIQYGKTMEKKALGYASSAKTVEEFLSLISEYDLANLKTAFKTYLSNNPNNIKGLERRILERKKSSLKVVSNDSDVGSQIDDYSKNNADMRKEMNSGSGSPVIIMENTNNTSHKTTNNTSVPHNNINPRLRR
jgi:hypothetical protein